MATAEPVPTLSSSLSLTDNFLIKLNLCRKDVDALFNELHETLDIRRYALLAEIDEIEKRYSNSKKAEDNFKNLETLIKEQKALLASMERFSNLMATDAKTTHHKTMLKTELDCYNWKAQIEVFSNISFPHNTTDLTSSINQLGAITISVAPDYTIRTAPLVLCNAAGTGNGEMESPQGIALDADGNIYITDICNNKILVFTLSGVFIREFGQEYFNAPHYICINNNNIYVSNDTSHSIVKCTITGEFISKMGSRGSDNNQFNLPLGIEFYDELLYICDCFNQRIQIMNEKLDWQKTKHDEIKSPFDIKIREDTIYVTNLQSVNNLQSVHILAQVKSLHILSIAGNYIRTLSHTFGKLFGVFYFTLDNYNNITISAGNRITILSLLNNTIIYSISSINTRGIAITTANKIVNVCNNATLKLF